MTKAEKIKFLQQKTNEVREKLSTNIVATIHSGEIKWNHEGKPIVNAKKWVRENIKENLKSEIGEIVFDESTIRNSLSHGFGQDKLDAILAIKPVIENGSYLGCLDDFNELKIVNHYFAGKVKFDNGEKFVFCRVRRAKGDAEHRFYVHEVFTEDEIKKAALQTGPAFYGKSYGRNLYLSILHDALYVKEKAPRFATAGATFCIVSLP